MGKIKELFEGLNLSISISEAVDKADAEYEALEAKYESVLKTQPLVEPEAETKPIPKFSDPKMIVLDFIYRSGNEVGIELPQIATGLKRDRLWTENILNNLQRRRWVVYTNDDYFDNLGNQTSKGFYVTPEGVQILAEATYEDLREESPRLFREDDIPF